MKAISLWEPWASAMALGFKQFETRSWPISYRGPLVICAAKRRMTRDEFKICCELLLLPTDFVSYGCAVCVVEVYGCISTEQFHGGPPDQLEAALGNYSPGRFAWITRNRRRLLPPVPVKGHQGLFDVPDDIAGPALRGLIHLDDF